MLETAKHRLSLELQQVLNAEQTSWLAAGLQKIAETTSIVDEVLNQSAGARRKLGGQQFGARVAAIRLADGEYLPLQHWSYADAGRGLMLLHATSAFPAQAAVILQNYFQQGDESEVAALTRLLILFPDGESLKFYAREVGRTNSKPLFAALAQYNPYPAAYYTEHEFNQLVLKALFMGVSIEPLLGLAARANAELSQMCEDYIKERVAAGRSIPPDIWLALAPFAGADGLAMLHAHSADASVAHRYFVVKALQGQADKADFRLWLDQRLALETDPEIRLLLTAHSF